MKGGIDEIIRTLETDSLLGQVRRSDWVTHIDGLGAYKISAYRIASTTPIIRVDIRKLEDDK